MNRMTRCEIMGMFKKEERFLLAWERVLELQQSAAKKAAQIC